MAGSGPGPLKVLVTGSVNGKIGALFKRVAAVNAKAGPFDMLLCAGSFFGADGSVDEAWASYLAGAAKAPIPTYILGPMSKAQFRHYAAVPTGGDLADNITYLGQQGVFTTLSGVRIAYLSGAFHPASFQTVPAPDEDRWLYHKKDVDALLAQQGKGNIDILLTPQWPSAVCTHSPTMPDDKEALAKSSAPISLVAQALAPRYHFVPSQASFFERAPFRNTGSDSPPTRFLALAHVGNAEKSKWLYAFNIVPASKMSRDELLLEPQGTTPCPFTGVAGGGGSGGSGGGVGILGAGPPRGAGGGDASFFFQAPGERKRKREGAGPPPDHYVCHICNVAGHWIEDCPQRKDARRPGATSAGGTGSAHAAAPRAPPKPAGPCWFCLSSPDVEKHLVVSVGTHVYVALAKGGLVPEHVLVLPIQHVGSGLELSQEAQQEVTKYRGALKAYFKSKGQVPIVFERNVRSQHMQLQVVPVPAAAAEAAEHAFVSAGARQNIGFEAVPDGAQLQHVIEPGSQYFVVYLPNGKTLVHTVRGRFNLQFGREAVAEPALLNMPERVDWRACKLDKSEEVEVASAFRNDFRSFDFNAM